MAVVLIYPIPETSHTLPTFKLARTLKRRGHRVVYLTIRDLRPLIEENGFELVPLLEDVFPPGWMERLANAGDAAGEMCMRMKAERHHRFLDGTVERAVADISPDAIIADVFDASMQFVAHKLRVPCIRLSTGLSWEREPGRAPLSSDRLPDASWRGRIHAWTAWARLYYDDLVADRKERAAGLMTRPWRWALELARYADCPEGQVKWRSFDGIPRIVGLPELMLCSPDLEHNHPQPPERIHAESVDLERFEDRRLPAERLEADKKLIYCSLGWSGHRFGDSAIRLYRALFSVLEARRDLQAIVTTGALPPSALEPIPSNAIVLSRTAQLEALERAAVAITHGGLGSIKEAMYYGVPMIVVPQGFDRLGNAARVEHHRIGFNCRSEESLPVLIDRALGGERAAEVAAMSARFRAFEAGTRGADTVEEIVKRRRAAA